MLPGRGFSPAGNPDGGSVLLDTAGPVSPESQIIQNIDEDKDKDEDGDSELSDVEDVFVGEEAEVPKVIKVESRPSKEEVAKHNVTHLPYRSWCRHCNMGRGLPESHRCSKSGGNVSRCCVWTMRSWARPSKR